MQILLDNVYESINLDQIKNILLKRYIPYNEDLNRVYTDVGKDLKKRKK
jgi:hypothetical protein